jgi:hypothetical protein
MQQVVGFVRDHRATHAPGIPWTDLHEGVAHCGLGMDLVAGERPLVALKHAGELGRMHFKVTLFITDRRLFGRDHVGTARDETVDIPFAHVTGCHLEKKTLRDELLVGCAGRSHKVITFAKELLPFFQGLARVPLDYRFFAPAPPASTPDDPTGARAARQRPSSGDSRIDLLLWSIDELARTGGLSHDDAADLVSRAVLLDQELRMGRAMSHGFWLSTLPRRALSQALRHMLGDPIGQYRADGVDTIDFSVANDHRVAKAVASSAVGLAVRAVLGVGWISIPRGEALRGIRVAICDFPCGSGFALSGMTGGPFFPLSRTSPRFVDAIHQAVFRLEAQALLARCTLGAPAAPEQLLSSSPAAVGDRLRQMGCSADLSAFFPTSAHA